jgi:hypothetical protein
MSRFLGNLAVIAILSVPLLARADVVTDWNSTLRTVLQHDGMHVDHKANPGWSTRSIAMMNGAIYDAFQSIKRTHAPFLYTQKTSGASLEAAVHQVARDLLVHCYAHDEEKDYVEDAYEARMQLITDGPEKTNGMNLGSAIAAAYIANRANDKAAEGADYVPLPGPGKWRPDPWHPDQVAWGPIYGQVPTFAVRDSNSMPNAHDQIALLPPLPELNSQPYTDAYNQVINYGALDVYGPTNTPTSRNSDQTNVGIFWGYDRPTMGPPPVLFVRSLEAIAAAVGNSPEDNARLFAMASIAQADAAIAAWDAKFEQNFWRPVAAIIEGNTDGNADTVEDTDWRPLGAPGPIPDDNNPATEDDFKDDFTPPFPAWTSGHATMGAAWYKSIALFYGTNNFDEADGSRGADQVTTTYLLSSEEANSGADRPFEKFWHEGELDIDSYAGSPDGENAVSRIFLGVHWIMDQRDGLQLGHSIADYVAANYFQSVPEPSAGTLGVVAALGLYMSRRRRGMSEAWRRQHVQVH